MPNYSYKALSGLGEVRVGTVVGESREAARQSLETQGLIVVRLRPQNRLFTTGRRPLGSVEFLFMVREMVALLRAGLTVTEVLALSSKREGQPVLASALDRLKKEVEEGASLSEACERQPQVFEPLFRAAVKTGESMGDLPSALEHYQRWLDKRLNMVNRLKQALVYPIFLLFMLGLVLVLLFAYSLPRFSEMYESFDAELPRPTQWLLAFSDALPVLIPVCLGVAVLGHLLLKRTLTDTVRERWHRRLLRLPVIGTPTIAYQSLLFTRTLSALLRSGMPLIAALTTAATGTGNRFVKSRIIEAALRIAEGKGLAEVLRVEPFLPASALKVVEAGENTGTLPEQLEGLAVFFEQDLDYRLARVTGILEPALMLVTGIVIGIIVILLYLPIFNIATVVG